MISTELRTRATAEVEPPVRIELTTYRLQGGCSTTELQGPGGQVYERFSLGGVGAAPQLCRHAVACGAPHAADRAAA